MLKKTLLLLISSCFFISNALFAQSIKFKQGYFLPVDLKYGREALVQDPLAYQLFNGSLKYPTTTNTDIDLNGTKAQWTAINADTSGNFEGDKLGEGYLYLSYEAKEASVAFLNIAGQSMVFVNGTPRGGDIYKYGWLYSPIHLQKGQNDILIRCSRWAKWQGVKTQLIFPEKTLQIATEDTTLPQIVIGKDNSDLFGAVVVINATNKTLSDLSIISKLANKETTTSLPSIPAMTSRKVPFYFNATGVDQKGDISCDLILKRKSEVLDSKAITIEAVDEGVQYSNTFSSEIDGSTQYYSVAPQSGEDKTAPALFLSVHGAGVEAIGQARAYHSKDWGVLVTPTNRRPRGFNWEDWGRLDALEVLDIAVDKFHPDPERIYLTGHSMGGHGTYYLGATYPGKWAAIAPCAGYPTLRSYGSSDGKIPEAAKGDMENLLLQASNPSNVLALSKNYASAGVYIHHGDSDKVVSVEYARQMRSILSEFHKDFCYHEHPGGSHWFGNESVDWQPIFDYFKWHTIPTDSMIDVVDFTTASPAISSQYYWVNVLQQQKSLGYSKIQLRRSKPNKIIKGTTENISLLSFDLHDFNQGDTIHIVLDDQTPVAYTMKTDSDKIYLEHTGVWAIGTAPSDTEKGTVRGGTFKAPFNHRMVFVYGTGGTDEENKWAYDKAIYDAEVWYYRGNGAVDIVSDKAFKASQYPDRGVIIYGNANTNKAWKQLLKDSPIQVKSGSIKVGDKTYEGTDLSTYFMWPRKDSKIASVGVIGGTGLKGMKATEANQYFAGGSGFPDFIIYDLDMLNIGIKGIKCTGYYDNDWNIDSDNTVFIKE